MTDELERRREECLQLRALLAEKSISTHSIAKQSYGGIDDLVNEDNELTMAYKSQRDIIRYIFSVTHLSCREECIHILYCQLNRRTLTVIDDLVNKDNELTMAYKSQRAIIRYVLTVTCPSCGEECIHALYCQTVLRWY